jgi:hypothetical protein
VSGSTARWMDAATGYQVLVGADQHPGLVRRLRELHGWRILVDGRGGIAVVRGA